MRITHRGYEVLVERAADGGYNVLIKNNGAWVTLGTIPQGGHKAPEVILEAAKSLADDFINSIN